MKMATKDKVQSFARNVWLAGLGAYGKGSETLTNKLDKAYEESNQLFNELVVKGGEIQTSLEAKIKEKSRFESKVDEVREKLGLNQSDPEQIDALTAKVDALTDIVAKLAEVKLAEQQAELAAVEETAQVEDKPKKIRKTKAKATDSTSTDTTD
jgi:uncharacterized phage infection (PIP) family protein YhgE